MENPLHLRAFEAFGANPLPMAYGEVYTALEQGVIDGAEAARSNYLSKRFFEVAPNWSEIGWMYLVQPLVMSERFFSSLSPEESGGGPRRGAEGGGRRARGIPAAGRGGARHPRGGRSAVHPSGRPERCSGWRARSGGNAAEDVDLTLVEAITGYDVEAR